MLPKSFENSVQVMLGQERLEAQSVPADTGARVESRFTEHDLKDKMNIYPANSHRRIKKKNTPQNKKQ